MRLRSEGGKSEVLESRDGFSGGAKVLHFAILAQSTVFTGVTGDVQKRM